MKSEPGARKVLKVLQFTDTHFFADAKHKLLGVDTAESFADVYKTAKTKHGIPDFYLFTGDLSQDETEESYKRLASAVSDCGAPCFFLPGNHDRRDEMKRGLLFESSPFKSERRLLTENWQIILLDSLVEGQVAGHLAENEINFLKACLDEEPKLNALICLHHHPVAMGARWLDQIGVDNGEQFMAIIEAYPQVKAVLWGHVHQQYDALHKGILLMATPSTCVQFKANSADFGIDPVPAGYRYLELSADGQVESSTNRTEKIACGLELSSAGY
ncbi:MAG: 3',5'-cyclic-AMP phosphodiesterase [Candidatus Obscuribacterales bacterium]|nr:3',5'-cyclic-AMP phosphodiesterase [Candidatus Obscuribacterales bacterium]